MKRVEKINLYCCIGLFASAEEPIEDSVKIKSTNFRGETAWYIEVPTGMVGYNLISHCPWCGKKLPATPYCAAGE